MKYIIFSSHTIKELTYLVNEILDEDDKWTCQGGVSIAYNHGGFVSQPLLYAQAMIKRD